MYYQPKHFKPEEVFTKKTCDRHLLVNYIDRQIWRLIDYRVSWTMDALREYFGTMICNDYLWGGKNEFRGYRPAIEILNKSKFCESNVIEATVGSMSSQHVFGRASDSKFKKCTAEEVREDIRKNPSMERYKFITFVEEGVSWFHFDVRPWDKSKSGILFWNPNIY